MMLTGRPDRPPAAAPGDPAGVVADALHRVAAANRARTGSTPDLPGITVLAERGAIQGLRRNGPLSCGGSFRTLATTDGWWGLSLPRPEDVEVVPALVEAPVADPWPAVTAWSAATTTADAVARGRLLGLACAGVPEPQPHRTGVLTRHTGGRRPTPRERPRVVDLTALWAGPLCAHLLARCGAEVIKVESVHRPDGARRGSQAFFDLLHAGAAMVALDFGDPADLDALRRLLDSADLVLEASRPRALARLGLDARHYVEHGTTWLSITARGRDTDSIGFGDDVAAGAGLVTYDGSRPLPCGDAIADPLTGGVAAAAAAEALLAEHATLIDVSMHHVAADAASRDGCDDHEVIRRAGRWWVTCADGDFPVAEPTTRPPAGRAKPLGADTARILGALT